MEYLPEVCTSAQQTLGGVNNTGPGAEVWVNPQRCSSDTLNAVCGIPTNGASMRMHAAMAPPQWAAIHDAAKINRFTVSYEIYAPVFQIPRSHVALYNGTVARSGENTPGGPTLSEQWEPRTFNWVAPFINGATISGAQLKAGNFGASFWLQGSQGGNAYVRATKLIVCYQNPKLSPNNALQMCEA